MLRACPCRACNGGWPVMKSGLSASFQSPDISTTRMPISDSPAVAAVRESIEEGGDVSVAVHRGETSGSDGVTGTADR